MESRLQRRLDWAESRKAKAEQGFAKAEAIASNIPMGQPILVGHHSERHHRRDIARIDSGIRQGVESSKMAAHHEQKADGIAAQLERSVFSDDADAVAQLEARIAEREAERDRIKAYNASCRSGKPDISLLQGGRARCLTNLGAKIRHDRERIEEIKRQAGNRLAAANAGGVIVRISEKHNWATVVFAEKPDRSIIDALKSAGFGWGAGQWGGYADRLPGCVRELAA